MVSRGWFWSQDPDKYKALMERAKQNLLSQAPLGSGLDQVIEVLREQDFSQSEWLLDKHGTLKAHYVERLDDLTWKTGPASWDIGLFCKFEGGILTDVSSQMRPTGL